MAVKSKECLNCGNPSIPGIGVLPLCSSCHALKTGPRGVGFQGKPTEDANTPTNPQG